MDKVFIIAEAGINHNGRMDLAKKIIDAGAEAGVDAVKFQAFIPEKLVSRKTEKAEYQKEQDETNSSQLEMLKKYQLSAEQLEQLKEYCDTQGVTFLATPFDEESLKVVDQLAEIIKVGSGEITNLPFLENIATTGKPVILSTGMSTIAEVDKAVEQIKIFQPAKVKSKLPPLTLLHCTSNYPCAYEHVNLKAMDTLEKCIDLPVGYSDHTLGIEVAIAAVARGASVVEKHFTLDKDMDGPDHEASVEPGELNNMVNSIRSVEEALGDGVKQPQESEKSVKKVARKSLVTTSKLESGAIIKKQNLSIKRPGSGIAPGMADKIIGLKLQSPKEDDEVFRWSDFKLS